MSKKVLSLLICPLFITIQHLYGYSDIATPQETTNSSKKNIAFTNNISIPNQITLNLNYNIHLHSGIDPLGTKGYDQYLTANHLSGINIKLSKQHNFFNKHWQLFWSLDFPLSFSKPHSIIMKKTISFNNKTSAIHLTNTFDYKIISTIYLVKNILLTHYANYKKIAPSYALPTLFLLDTKRTSKNNIQSYSLINMPSLSYQWIPKQQSRFFLYFEKTIDTLVDANSFQTYPLTFNTKKLSWGFEHWGKFDDTQFLLTLKNYHFIYNDELLDHHHISIRLRLQQKIFNIFIVQLTLEKASKSYLTFYKNRQHKDFHLTPYHSQKRSEDIKSIGLHCSWNFLKTLFFLASYKQDMHQNPSYSEFDVTKHLITFKLKYELTTSRTGHDNTFLYAQ